MPVSHLLLPVIEGAVDGYLASVIRNLRLLAGDESFPDMVPPLFALAAEQPDTTRLTQLSEDWELDFKQRSEMLGRALELLEQATVAAGSSNEEVLPRLAQLKPLDKDFLGQLDNRAEGRAKEMLAPRRPRCKRGPWTRVWRALEIISESAGAVRDLAGKFTTTEAQSKEAILSMGNENIVEAHRVMQLTADRAGLLLCGDLVAAIRSCSSRARFTIWRFRCSNVLVSMPFYKNGTRPAFCSTRT